MFKSDAEMKPLNYVDVHIHLSDEEYVAKIDEIVSEARKSNVVALVSNSMDLETSLRSLELAEKYAGTVYAALGVHPWSVNALTEDQIHETCQLILKQQRNNAVVAIGEVGLDYKYAKIWDKQLMVFDEMLRLAEKLDLPVIIHSRGTTSKIVEMLPSYRLKRVLLHWFSNPMSILPKVVARARDGPVRYFKAPFNGKPTTPAFIPTVVRAAAEIKQVDVADVAEQIIKNFEDFFQLKLNFNKRVSL